MVHTIGKVVRKVVGTKNDRVIKRLWPVVHEINRKQEEYQGLTDEQLQAKTDEFKQRLQNGETVDDLMVEAFAVVKDACRRLVGSPVEVPVMNATWQWDMVPFDVQLLGAIALHRGSVAEMATGEGKTLVATMPLYLNALTGRNCQLVTVNDFLARRDAEWMGVIYKFLGLTVGCIQHDMGPEQRRQQYGCDITYGTNNEFGFDYLRDMAMSMSADEIVQRDYYYAILDEVDSVLIDEARTPLIISGPASSDNHRYDEFKPVVSDLFRRQNLLCSRLIDEARNVLTDENSSEEACDEAALKICQARMGMPKHKQLHRLLEDPATRKRVERKEQELRSDSNRGMLQSVKEELFFSMDERNQEAELTEQGRRKLRPDDENAFVLPDLAAEFSQIDEDPALSDEEKTKRRQELEKDYDDKNEMIHTVSQLLRAYCLFEQDVDYVVQDNKVIIVDEFTGRLMPGRRYSDGLHQALEAKEEVQIENETQTLASVTIQNYFRMYEKRAGMTGTAETEANEFSQIYDMDVVVVPTNRPCVREDFDDRIFKTQREKYRAVVEEVSECHERGQPVLLGTVSVDVSEVLSRMLQRRKVPHSVLNAKNHQYEADIVSRAGQRGSVTIATNMAGRGTDIKLGEGVKERGGLHVIGSARHDARRIDRQLRGRCARQGDPGSSRFYVSLEDNLMRLFGSDRVSGIMEKLGVQEGEELSHPWLNKSIQRAQKRVEQQNFSIRKRTLEYDDVMNRQRQVVYGLRQDILKTDDPREMLFDFVNTMVADQVDSVVQESGETEPDTSQLLDWLRRTFPVAFRENDVQLGGERDKEALREHIVQRIDDAYQAKERDEDPEALRWLERQLMLNAIDRLYKEHLYAMDLLRQGVQLRAYGQKDPLVEYKQEAFRAFAEMMDNIKQEIVSSMFKSSTTLTSVREMLNALPQQEMHDELGQLVANTAGGEQEAMAAGAQGEESEEMEPLIPVRRDQPKVGRNEPCPCGSGLKYKKCCGK